MYKNAAVIIPALESNKYGPAGDLVEFGDLSLLEWKITQVKSFIDVKSIFVSTPSDKIAKIAKTHGIHVIHRKTNAYLSEEIIDGIAAMGKEIIIWAQVTSPFIGPSSLKNMLDKFICLENRFDSLITVLKLNEYIIFKNKALNFEMTGITGRELLEPVYKITNGCFIARRQIYSKYKKYFGVKPYLYEVDALTALEIKDVQDLTIANDLISLYFKKELKV